MKQGGLEPKEIRRYRRHLMLPGFGEEAQEKIKSSSVLVVGAGGLGCPVLQYLAAAGVGKIGIADFDRVDEDNLHRQVLYGDKDLGKMKAIIARERLQIRNPMLEYEVHNLYLSPQNILPVLEPYDLVVDATDNFPTRYLLNDACLLRNKPWVFGSIYTYEGQLSVFNYRNGPSLRCLFPRLPQAPETTDPSETGIIGVLPGIIGTMMANESLKILAQTGEVLSGKFLLLDIRDYSLHILRFDKNPDNFSSPFLRESYG